MPNNLVEVIYLF